MTQDEEDVSRRVETFVLTRCVYKFGRPQFKLEEWTRRR